MNSKPNLFPSTAVFLAATFLVATLTGVSASQLMAQDSATGQAAKKSAVSGLVLDRQKYSFTLQSAEGNFKVEIPNGTPMLMKLNKPKFDLANQTVSINLAYSSATGKPEDDQILTWPLPTPTIVNSMFRNEQEKAKAFSGNVRLLDRYVISSQALDNGPLAFDGELSESRTPGQFFLDDNGGVHTVKLGARRGLLHGFTISDLKPMQTSVWVQGQFDGDTLVASRIRFEYLGDAQANFNPSLPNVLSLGDVTSSDYQRPLIEALAGKANVHHPPVWLGPSKNFDRLHHYVGLLNSQEPDWDVITFNFGLRDAFTTRQAYQQNLRDAIRVLQRTGAKLVWVNSTPLPNGIPAGDPGKPLEGMVRGRMELQNTWASSVINEFPNIETCDIWNIVKNNDSATYDVWWEREYYNFDYPQSIPLGRAVASASLRSIRSQKQINGPEVHDAAKSVNASR